MKSDLNLSISSPCAEKWDSFSKVSDGAFCSTCQKVVVDFTGMTDEEVISFFQKNRSKTCGRFKPGQLRSYSISMQRVNPGFSLLKAGSLAILMMLISKPSSAQAQVERQKTEISTERTNIPVVHDTEIFTGIVRSEEDHAPLPGVNVVLQGTTIGTATDHEGKFEFPQVLKKDDVLIFSFIGFTSKELKITDNIRSRRELPIELCMDSEIMGEISVGGLYAEPKQSLWSRIKSIF